MANVSYWSAQWVGMSYTGPVASFHPGEEHYWETWPIDLPEVISVTAHPIPLPSVDYELMVKDVRTYIDTAGNRKLLFTIRNTGRNSMAAYTMRFSSVIP